MAKEEMPVEKTSEERLNEMYVEALEYVVREGKASIAFIQRRCEVGYNRGGKILEWMEEQGFVGPFNGERTREVFATMKDVETLKEKLKKGEDIGRKEEVLQPSAYDIISSYQLPKTVEENPSLLDKLYIQALQLVVETQQASISMLQRKLSIGFNRAGEIIDWMEACGYITPFDGVNARKVLLTKERFDTIYGAFV